MDKSSVSYAPSNVGGFSDLLLKINKPKKLEPVPRWRWSSDDVATLTAMAASGSKCKEVAEVLGRTYEATHSRARMLGVKFGKHFNSDQVKFILFNYPLYGAAYVAKSLNVTVGRVNYFIANGYSELVVKTSNDANPPIPRNILPYHMAKRVSFLGRDCPLSCNKIQDSVVIFYDTTGAGTPMMAIHLDELLPAIKNYLGDDFHA